MQAELHVVRVWDLIYSRDQLKGGNSIKCLNPHVELSGGCFCVGPSDES